MSYYSSLPEMPSMEDEPGRFAYDRLRRHFLSTVLIDARREIPTPADTAENATVLELIMRDLNGPHGTDLLSSMVRVLATSTQGVQILSWLAGDYGQRHWAAKLAQDVLHTRVQAQVQAQESAEHDRAEPTLGWPE